MNHVVLTQSIGGCGLPALVNDNPVPMLVVSSDFNIRSVNNAAAEVLRARPDEVVGSDFSQWFVVPSVAQGFLSDVFSQVIVKERELAISCADGRCMDISCDANMCRCCEEADMAFVVLRDTIDVRLCAEQRSFPMTRDPLTSIFNRTHIREFVGKCIVEVKNDDRSTCLMHVGLDRFNDVNDVNDVNDAYGHYVGDQLLRQFARNPAGTSVREIGQGWFCLLPASDDCLSVFSNRAIVR